MKVPSIRQLVQEMVEIGIITSDQLKKAEEIWEEEGGDLGEILIAEGFINEDVFTAFLGKKSEIDYVHLADYGDLAETTVSKIPEAFARRKKLIPLKLENNTLTVAISDAMDIFAIDDLKALTGMKIDIVLAVKKDIEDAIEKYYTGDEGDDMFGGDFDDFGDDEW
jgi:type IV pilus assembly protein PilB